MITNNSVTLIEIRNDSESIVNIHMGQETYIEIAPDEIYNLTDVFTRERIANSDVAFHINEDTIVLVSHSEVVPKLKALKIIYNAPLIEEPRDRSDKIRVHQTSRKLGTKIGWTGIGDDPTDLGKVGGGQLMELDHKIDDGLETHLYIDFNIASNETWLHEGYMTWKDCHLDKLSLEMVPRVTSVSASTNTNYNLYGGYMVIPAAGDGTITLDDDMTDPNNGLIYMPNNDLNEAPTAFWNADYNSTTKLFENITPAPYGNGRYNMFSVEIVLARFLNTMPLLGSGFMALNSSDTDQMGQGMRLKMHADTNGTDHEWSVACLMCLHRAKSV